MCKTIVSYIKNNIKFIVKIMMIYLNENFQKLKDIYINLECLLNNPNESKSSMEQSVMEKWYSAKSF